jgi:hypothetical protein
MRWHRRSSIYSLAAAPWRSWFDLVTAGHETGHLLRGIADGRNMDRVSIIPRGDRLGFARCRLDGLAEIESMLDEGCSMREVRKAAETEGEIAMAGHAGAELVTGQPTLEVEAVRALFDSGLGPDEWDAELRERDDDVQRIIECSLVIEPDGLRAGTFVARAYDRALAFLRRNRTQFDGVVETLLAWRSFDPRPLLATLPPLRR